MSIEHLKDHNKIQKKKGEKSPLLKEGWECPCCGRLWDDDGGRDNYGCQDWNCPH